MHTGEGTNQRPIGLAAVSRLEATENPEIFSELCNKTYDETPGANNFVEGIEVLWLAAQAISTRERCRLATNAISTTFMSLLLKEYYAGDFEEWQNRRKPGLGQQFEEDAPNYPSKFWQDEKIQQQDIRNWLALADELQDLINL